jgi:hypothetical protein
MEGSMSRFIQSRDLLIALLAAALALAVAALWFRPAPHAEAKATPDFGSLQQSLEKAAQTALPALPLSNEQIIVKAGGKSPAGKAQEIADLANASGGSGVVSQADGKSMVLARIPAAHAGKFYQKITGHEPPAAAGGDAAPADQWFDITIAK